MKKDSFHKINDIYLPKELYITQINTKLIIISNYSRNYHHNNNLLVNKISISIYIRI